MLTTYRKVLNNLKSAKTVALSTLLLGTVTITGCVDQDKTSPNQVYIYTNEGNCTTTDTPTTTADNTTNTPVTLEKQTLSGDITSNTTLTADKIWILDGLVTVKDAATLTIEAGTTIAGKDGTGSATSYMIIDKGAKIMAEGTASSPITFTSEKAINGEAPAVGQWGGITIIGKAGNEQVNAYEVNSEFVADSSDLADNSGVLKHVKILNSGITMEQDKEINGLSFVGVGSGTTVEDITVDLSDDDGIEIWGGTVNLTNVTVTNCTDDYFDVDDGYAGTVKNLNITVTGGNAGIEMSGTTSATFDGFNITMTQSDKEGAIYFKKDGIGGHFKNGTITDNSVEGAGAIHSKGAFDSDNTSFTNVTLAGSSSDEKFTGDSATDIKALFDAGEGNSVEGEKKKVTLSGDITSDNTLTADTIWILDGLVVVKDGVKLTVEAGTTIAGKDGTGSATSYMIVDKGSRIIAKGTESEPIIFTSEKAVDGETAAVGQWGGLVIIGKAGNEQVKAYEVNSEFEADSSDLADDSGTLQHVKILNSGITMEQDKEINGLSLIGVGSDTTIEDITVDLSDDDGIEIWGGTVELTNITISNCTDDYFDIDDGYAGTVKNLNINVTGGNAGIEMSGTTHATFDGFNITVTESNKEGGIYFKKDGIGGHFTNGTVTDNSVEGAGAIHSAGIFDADNTSFTSVTLAGSSSDDKFTGDSATDIETLFDAGSGNSK
ncbi:MAG: right-handed parallel beta-helix repeat-containing protein [Epsilonproteobacteria bacterium]|nr:right-handed parallel beta-helix repeat-containing protein [Campylobacterota bacterium]